MNCSAKQDLIILIFLLSFLFSCKNKENSRIHINVIDIELSLKNLTRLKVSDFGKTIRFIPLETVENGLAGNNPVIKVSKNYIIIETQKSCLLFDKKDGKFIASIGHFGQDPYAYSSSYSRIDEKEELLYFLRYPNQLVSYDVKGNFNSKIEFTSPPGLASCYLFTDSNIIGHFTAEQYTLGVFSKEGLLKDTILYPFNEYNNSHEKK